MIKKFRQLTVILFFLAIGFFAFENKVEAACNCTNTSSCSSAGGTCKPQAQCSGTTKTGLCPCATAAECVCCIPGAAPPTPTPTIALGNYCYLPYSSECKNALGSPPNTCCRTGGCSSECGTIGPWQYCYAQSCCIVNKVWYWADWTILKCSVADTCKGDCYLYPGICSDSGCTVGGKYKICCKPDGSCCNCRNGKNTGTCPSGC